MSSPLDQAVAVMDRLRSPGGCPWDASQTHRSLARYLIEETYETIEAIETDNLALLREELGDLLLQVLFHARLAQELPSGEQFSINDVAEDLVAKLVHRHPHVFGSTEVADADEVNDNWERLKVAEKGRRSAVDGVPLSQPALALAGKLVTRAERAQLRVDVAGDGIGERLFALAREATEAGVEPESALRDTTRRFRAAILAAEAAREGDPAG
jgi:XTP/dITP diphosphohydrolase